MKTFFLLVNLLIGALLITGCTTFSKEQCPKTSEDAFLKSCDSGRLDYLTKQVKQLQGKINDLESEISGKEAKINSPQGEVDSMLGRSCP